MNLSLLIEISKYVDLILIHVRLLGLIQWASVKWRPLPCVFRATSLGFKTTSGLAPPLHLQHPRRLKVSQLQRQRLGIGSVELFFFLTAVRSQLFEARHQLQLQLERASLSARWQVNGKCL